MKTGLAHLRFFVARRLDEVTGRFFAAKLPEGTRPQRRGPPLRRRRVAAMIEGTALGSPSSSSKPIASRRTVASCCRGPRR